MKRNVSIVIIIATLLLIAAPGAFSATVTWKDLTWTIRGTSNSATVTEEGYLSISVLGGNSGDPGTDNWAVYAKNFIPTSTNPPASMWMQFTFTDPGGTYSPRAYTSGRIPNGELLMQGGALAPNNPETWVNTNVWVNTPSPNGSWPFNGWTSPYANRPAGDHTFKVGLGSNGAVDVFYDGSLVQSYRVGQSYWAWDNDDVYRLIQFNWTADYLKYAYLGVDTAVGTTATITYKDFQWGTEYQPVPLPGTVLLLGSGLAGLALYRQRRKFFKR